MIEGYIGRPGAGKTYTMTARAIRARDRGRRVFANYPIHGCWLFTPDQLLDLPPGLVLIDEAHLWFPARQAISLPPSWLEAMSQTRKVTDPNDPDGATGWDILWSAQHENRVDRVIRDVSNWLHRSTSWFPSPTGSPRLFSTECYEPEYFRRKGHRVSRAWYPFRQSVASSYDTMGRIEKAAHTARKSDPYAKRAS